MLFSMLPPVLKNYNSHKTDKSISVIDCIPVFRSYANVEVVWIWPFIDTCQTSERRRRGGLNQTGQRLVILIKSKNFQVHLLIS